MSKQNIIPTGKYKGLTVQQVLETDPQYILTTLERHQKISFSDEVLEEAQQLVEYNEHIEMDRDYEYQRLFRRDY